MIIINSSLFGDKKLQSFLLLLLKEVELNEINAESIKSVGIKYKKLKTIFDDDDEIKKYLEYSDKNGFIKLEFISKQQIRDKKIPNEAYISKITPDHTLIKPEVFYEVKRYYKINFYPNDVFIFEYNKYNIQKIKNLFSELDENPNKIKLNLSELSPENLERIQKVLKIILDKLELQGINELVGNKIPLKRFEKEDIFYDEVISILNKINEKREEPLLEILNESIDYRELRSGNFSELERLENENAGMKFLDISRKDLEENVILRIKNLSRLKEIKRETDEKLKWMAEIRVEEIENQLEEGVEKEKEKEALKKEIIEEANKKIEEQIKPLKKLEKQISLVARSSSIKNYEEAFKKISEQLAPTKNILNALKSALAKYNTSATTIQHTLTPVMQRLTIPIKQIEKAMKTLKEHSRIEIPNAEALIPSDIRRAKQEAEMVSELKDIKKLMAKLLTKNSKKEVVGEINKQPVEIVGRDKIVQTIKQYGNKDVAEIKNISDNYPSKKWFSPNNPLVWVIGSIIIAIAAGLISNWF